MSVLTMELSSPACHSASHRRATEKMLAVLQVENPPARMNVRLCMCFWCALFLLQTFHVDCNAENQILTFLTASSLTVTGEMLFTLVDEYIYILPGDLSLISVHVFIDSLCFPSKSKHLLSFDILSADLFFH